MRALLGISPSEIRDAAVKRALSDIPLEDSQLLWERTVRADMIEYDCGRLPEGAQRSAEAQPGRPLKRNESWRRWYLKKKESNRTLR